VINNGIGANPMLPDDDERRLWKWGLPRCEHPTRQPVRLESEGRWSCRWQCAACGKLGPVLRAKDHPDAPLWDATALDQWTTALLNAKRQSGIDARQRHAMRVAARPAEDEEWREAYNAYLRTDEWQRQRRRIMERDGYRCQANGPNCTGSAREVHHRGQDLAYRYLHYVGWTPDYLLVALCSRCHQGERSITEADRAMRRAK
jgi:hypothetical protein